MRLNYRCTKSDCRKRCVLTKQVEFYVRTPKCKGCGRKHTLSFDPHVRLQTIKRTCRCGGIHWPHRRGTILSENEFCLENTLEDVEDWLDEKNEGWIRTKLGPDDPCPF